jgi:hypothetical protein
VLQLILEIKSSCYFDRCHLASVFVGTPQQSGEHPGCH